MVYCPIHVPVQYICLIKSEGVDSIHNYLPKDLVINHRVYVFVVSGYMGNLVHRVTMVLYTQNILC